MASLSQGQLWARVSVRDQVGVTCVVVCQQGRRVVDAKTMCPISPACGLLVPHPLCVRKRPAPIPRSNCQNKLQPSNQS